ncbi:MAG: hypothetical protein DME19_12675 [Verrucomicrobia bacterium]|nr:MAG: hypothetical protein DME19_12675 [Verrucomicrobiota bacterium]
MRCADDSRRREANLYRVVDIQPGISYQGGMKLIRSLLVVSTLIGGLNPLRAADAPATFKVSEFTFTRQANWEWVESTSQMRKAELKVVDAATNAKAEVVFYHFGPGSAGGAQANVDRWLGQFEEPREKINAKTEEVTVGKHTVTYVSAQGTYKSGMPGGPQTPMPNYALLGAIIAAEQGSVFVKMTGPKDLTKSVTADFRKMIESALK